MSPQKSLSDRVAQLRQLRNAAGAGSIPSAEAIPGDWGPNCLAFSASYAQSRLWFLHQLQPHLSSYHMPALWRLSGELDLEALQRALSGLVERHPSLRTSFQLQEGELLQIVHPAEPFALVAEPLAGRDADAVIGQWLDAERADPLDLSAGLLIRARLLRVDPHEHRLLINQHHIASDGWSCTVLARDLAELYNAHHAGRSPQCEPLSIQYQDYAQRQRQRLNDDRLQQLRAYWIPQLTGHEPLELPTDHPRPSSQSEQGSSVDLTITAEQLAPFEAFCKSRGATLQMGFVALLALILNRYSRQDDVVIGVPIWGRNQPELEPLIGFFVNTLPIRIHLDGSHSIEELLDQVKATSLDAYDHQELPFEQMVDALKLSRDPSRNPLVQVVLQLIELPEATPRDMDGLAVQAVAIKSETARFDLEITLRRLPDGGIKGAIIYPTVLFSSQRMEQLAGHLQVLLEAVPASGDQPLKTLPLLTKREQWRLQQWQNGPAMERCESSVHELFAAQVASTPDAFAVAFQDRHLTYAELSQRVDSLAQALSEAGVIADALVAICLERSIEQIVTLLAILKTGAAYLALEPAWPLERHELLLREADCRLLVTSGSLTEAFASAQTHRLAIHDLQDDLELRRLKPAEAVGRTQDDSAASSAAQRLAYVAFTSGSTGIPKAVAIENRSIVRLVDTANGFHLGPGSVTLALSPLAFDLSTFEIWGPLLNGGALVIAPPGIPTLTELAYLLRTKAVTTLWLTAGLFHSMVEAKLSALAGVKQVLAGGDVLSPKSVKALLKAFPPGHELINGYGPTECTTFASCHRMQAKAGVDPYSVPIGRPVAATHVCVLDAAGQPCPMGVPGELHLGGIGLAREYLNQPERTAAQFIADPRSKESPMRLYKTGDLASWNANGTLAFHGRLDTQIKLRGFRVEPGEIEVFCASHPAIERAKVIVHRDPAGTARLVCYWTVHETKYHAAPSHSELRAFLATNLPEHMVPSQFIQLESFPLTANGKPDLRALPAPQFGGSDEQRPEAASDLEKQLQQIWCELLAHASFGPADNFFMVGGDSLLAVRLAVAIEEQFAVELSVAAIFRWPTIAEQASYLSAYLGADRSEETANSVADQCLVPLQPKGSLPPLYAIHGLGGRIGYIYKLARLFADDRPVFGLQSPEQALEKPGLQLEDYAEMYADQIMAHHGDSPLHLIGYSVGGWYAFAVARALRAKGATVGSLVLMDTGPIKREVRYIDYYVDLSRTYTPTPIDIPIHLLCTIANQERYKEFWQAQTHSHVTINAILETHVDLSDANRHPEIFAVIDERLVQSEATG